MSSGPRFSDLRQRAASRRSAVESGPPEMARMRAGWPARPANSDRISAALSAAPPSAADTLLLALDALLHGGGGFRILAAHLGERRTGHFLLLHGRERLRKPQQRLRRLGVAAVLGGKVEEGLRRGVIALALKQTLAQPELCIGGAAVGRIFLQEGLEGVFRQRVILPEHIAVAKVIGVLRRIRGRRHRGHRAGGAEIARRRRRQRTRFRRRSSI